MKIKYIKGKLSRRAWLERTLSRIGQGSEGGGGTHAPDADGEPTSTPSDEVAVAPMEASTETVIEYLSETLMDKLVMVEDRWSRASELEDLAHGHRRGAVARCNQILVALAKDTIHGRNALEYRAIKESFSIGLLDTFGLRHERPRSHLSRQWLILAADLIKGDAVAVAAGYDPMVKPSTAELSQLLAKAKTACKEADDADLNLETIQEELRTISDEVGELFLDVAAYLRFSLRRKPSSARQRIMRKFGFDFQSVDGSTEEETELPEPEAPQAEQEEQPQEAPPEGEEVNQPQLV